MPLHFRCANCRHLLSIGRRKAGTDITCPICHRFQKVPDLESPELRKMQRPMAAVQPRCGSEWTVRLASLVLALVLMSLLGGLIWIFPQPRKEPLRSEEKQQANLSPNRFLPLVQEVESAPAAAPQEPLPPPVSTAAVNRPPNPRPTKDEDQPPPDLSPPPPPAKTSPKKKPLPDTNRGEAELLGEELVEADLEQRNVLLQKLRDGKGSEYTQALAAAIGRLSDEAKNKAREILIERLTRFTSTTLLTYLGFDNPELRRAAVLALANKDDKTHLRSR